VNNLDGLYLNFSALSDVLPRLGQLKHFTLTYTDHMRSRPPPSIVDLVASLPSLEGLTLMPVPELSHEEPAGVVGLKRAAPMFPTLRRLSIYGTVESCIAFLSRAGSFPSVSSITADFIDVHEPLSFMESFASFFSAATLLDLDLRLTVMNDGSGEDDTRPYNSIGDAFRPLTRFSRLESLDLSHSRTFNPSDTDISALAPAWRHLRVFRTSCAGL